MKIIICFCLVSLINLSGYAQHDTKSIQLFTKKFTMSIPKDIDSMSSENIAIKYHKTPDSKSFYYATADLDFSIVIVQIGEGVKETDLTAHRNELTSQFTSKGLQLEENEIRKVNNHTLLIVSFYSNVTDGKVFNRRFFAVVSGKLLMVTFNSTTDNLVKRKALIEQCISSVTIQ